MNEYWFDIIRRSRKRYEWVFVAFRDGRPKVLARSGRDYRSRKKTRRAIRRLQYVFPRAGIRSRDPYRLRYTKFEIVPGVQPLPVTSAPSGYVPAAAPRREFAAATTEQETPRKEPEEKTATSAGQKAEPVAATAKKAK